MLFSLRPQPHFLCLIEQKAKKKPPIKTLSIVGFFILLESVTDNLLSII